MCEIRARFPGGTEPTCMLHGSFKAGRAGLLEMKGRGTLGFAGAHHNSDWGWDSWQPILMGASNKAAKLGERGREALGAPSLEK